MKVNIWLHYIVHNLGGIEICKKEDKAGHTRYPKMDKMTFMKYEELASMRFEAERTIRFFRQISCLADTKFIGCASHQYNLAVIDVFLPKSTPVEKALNITLCCQHFLGHAKLR